MSSIAIVIPFYNGETYIGKCVDSIMANGVPATQVYIVDNSPRQGALAEIHAKVPGLKVIRTEVGLGFGRACNVGITAALDDGASKVLITNQDTILGKDSVGLLSQALDEYQGFSILAPLNYTYGFEGIEDLYVKYFLSQCPHLVSDAVSGKLSAVYSVQNVVGACFVIRAQCIRELGLFDELYFMYREDDDLCRRYRLAGRRLGVVPAARVAHAHSLTSDTKERSIERWTRQSRQLFVLKDITEPFWKCVGRVAFAAASDYVRCAAKFEVRELLCFVWSDLRDAVRIGSIIDGRQRERALLECERRKPRHRGLDLKSRLQGELLPKA
jgi:GT2 family glycosyltransferase